MLREAIRVTMWWLRRAIHEPFEELSRWQRAARFAYDLGRYGARQLREDRAPQMASALAFRTLFGMAPVLVVATILVKATKGTQSILGSLHDAFVAAGLDKLHVTDTASAETTDSISLSRWLDNLMEQLVATDMSAVGWVGFAVIVYAAIGLMVTIENSFNTIYRAPDGRPWTRRVPLYWFLLTLSPLLVALASYVNNQFTDWIESVSAWHGLLIAGRWLWSFGLVWLFMFAMYTLVPNSTVAIRPALTGALVATLLMEAGKNTLGVYLGNAFAINQLYGSLGLVPLFMFWVYLMWLAVLFGLEVSAILQMLQGRSIAEIDHPHARTGIFDPMTVLTVMEFVAERFATGHSTTTVQIADTLSLPEPLTGRIIDRLVNDTWLHRVEGPEPAVSLAKPPDKIEADPLLDVAYDLVDQGAQRRSSALASRIREAQQQVLQGITLASLVAAADTEAQVEPA